jgi:hypothetical protein
MPFFSRIVVTVAVDTSRKVEIRSADQVMAKLSLERLG